LVSITDFYQIQSASNVAELEKKPLIKQKNPTLLPDDNTAFNKPKIKGIPEDRCWNTPPQILLQP